MRSTFELQQRITELQSKVRAKQVLITDDKRTWNVLNHQKIMADIDLLNKEILTLEWVLGKR